MSGEQDESQKTEEPTTKRREDARKKGQVAFSKEIGSLLCLIVIYILLNFYTVFAMSEIKGTLSGSIINAHDIIFDTYGVYNMFKDICINTAIIFSFPMLLFIVAALSSGVLQNGFMVTWSAIAPKLERISLFKGLKRLFSSKSVIEFLKGIFKIIIVGYVGFMAVSDNIMDITAAYDMEAASAFEFMKGFALKFLTGVISIMVVLSVLDLLYQKYSLTKSLMMTKQEIKDELKNSEGSPEIKAKLKKIRNDILNQNMQNAVPKADVVITNPTHYAIALQYDADVMPAPRVIAKGRDFIAQKIKALAYENNIVTVENKPLALALYKSVEINDYISEEHYQAVADIINYVWSLRDKQR